MASKTKSNVWRVYEKRTDVPIVVFVTKKIKTRRNTSNFKDHQKNLIHIIMSDYLVRERKKESTHSSLAISVSNRISIIVSLNNLIVMQ